MSKIIKQIIEYSVDELKKIYKTEEVFRKYPKNLKFALENDRQNLSKLTNDIEVSNIGNIKINGILASQFLKEDKDLYVTLQVGIEYKVYRLVAETWLCFPFEDTNGWQVHHIFNDYNNRANNLIWCEKADHIPGIHGK